MIRRRLLACVLVVALASRAFGQATAPADPAAVFRSYFDVAATLLKEAADDPVLGDDAPRSLDYIQQRLRAVDVLKLTLDRNKSAIIEKLERMEDHHQRQMLTQDVVRLALLLHEGALASDVLLQVSQDDQAKAVASGQAKPEWPKLEILAANVPTAPAPPPRAGPNYPLEKTVKNLREPIKSQVAQALQFKSWQTIDNTVDGLKPPERSQVRGIEAAARLQAGDVPGAERAARLCVEASTGEAIPSQVASAGQSLAIQFWEANQPAAARSICARAARLAPLVPDNRHTTADAMAKLAVEQLHHGDLAAAIAWIDRIVYGNFRQHVRTALALQLIDDVMQARAAAPLVTQSADAAVPADTDGLFENNPVAFWIELAAKRTKDGRYELDQWDEDATPIALAAIGKPAVTPLIDWVKRLAAGNELASTSKAWQALADIGGDAVPPLIELLHAEGELGDRAAGCLTQIHGPAITALIGVAGDPDAKVRQRVARALMELVAFTNAAEARSIAAALTTLGKDADQTVRQTSLAAMDELLRARKTALDSVASPEDAAITSANPLAAFVVGLKDPQPELRVQAAAQLQYRGTPEQLKPLLPALTDALDDPESKVRVQVLLAIAKAGPSAEALMPRLLDWHKLCGSATDGSPGQIANASAQALAAIGPPAVAPLIEQLKSNDEYVRRFARDALKATQPATVAANIKPFADLLSDPEHGWWVCNVIGPAGPAATPLVLQLLASEDPLMRDHAMQIAYQVFQKQPDPQLLSAVIDKLIAHPEDDPAQTSGVIQAMGGRAKLIERISARSDPPEARAVLMDALTRIQDYDQPAEQIAALWRELYHGEPSASVRAAAVRAYITKVQPPKPVGPNLEPLGDRDPAVRLAVVNKLLEGNGSGEFDPTNTALLTNLLHDPSPEVQLATARLLRRGQTTAGPAVLTLLDLLKGSKDEVFKLRVIEVANEDHRFDELLMNGLAQCTNDPSPAVRLAAIRTLSAMYVPPEKLNALHAGLLVTLRDDKDPQVRNEAAVVLLRRGPNDEPAPAAGYVHPPPGSPEIVALLRVASAPRQQVDQTIQQVLAAMKVPVVRARLYELLVRFRGGEMAGQPLILAALAEPTPEVRRVALKLATEFPSRDGRDGEQIFKLVSPLLSDSDPAVRMAAMQVLKRGWGGMVVRPLKDAMAKYPDDIAFRQAASLLIHRTMIQSRI